MKKEILISFILSLSMSALNVSAAYRGDLNGDGKVDLADMAYLAKAIKGGTADTACDINASGKVDDADLHTLADIIISGVLSENSGLNVGIGGWDDDGTDYGGTVKAPARRTRSAEETTFYIKNPKAEGTDGKHSAELGIDNATETHSALLFNIELPGDLKFDENSIVALENSNLDGHILYGIPKVKQTGEWDWEKKNVLRFIVFNPDLKPIKNATGIVGYIHYSCNETYDYPKFVDCQVLDASGNNVTDIQMHESESMNWHEIPVSYIYTEKTELSLSVGDTDQLWTNVEPSDATNKDLSWSSSNNEIVTVSSEGLVTAVSPGTAIITATAHNNVSVSWNVTVNAIVVEVESVVIDNIPSELKVGESATLTAVVYPENATDKTVVWSSDNEAVANVDAAGKVTAKALGKAKITATCGDAIATCEVSVVATPAESVTLSQPTAQLKVGESVTLTAAVAPDNTTDKTVKWTSSNSSIATVQNGVVTAVALGTATITATCGNVSATCEVSVVATTAESVTLSQPTAQLKVGESVTLTAAVVPDNTTDKTVTWTSSNSGVATVQNGVVTAVAPGEATITASCGAVNATCQVTVTENVIEIETLTLNRESLVLEIGDTYQLVANITPAEATYKDLEWWVDDVTVATITAGGLLTVVGEGSTSIHVRSVHNNAIEAICRLNAKSGVDTILVDNEPFDVYDINGKLIRKSIGSTELKELSKGVYILVQGHNRIKVMF